MAPEIGYEGEVVLVKETTWGTAVQGGADSKFPFRSFQDGKNIEFVENANMFGSPVMRLSKQSTKKFTPGFSGDAFYAAGLPLALAIIAGSDAITAVNNSTPAQVGSDHLFVPQRSNLGKSATLARKLKGINAVKEFPGFKPGSVELSMSQGGQLQLTVSGPAKNLINTGTTNDVASIEAATIDAPVELIMYAGMTVWLADQDGAAFQDSDKLHVDTIRWMWQRGYKIDAAASSQLIREPVPSGFFSTEFSLQLPLEEDLSHETDLLNGQPKRAKVQFSGSQLTSGDAGQNNEINLYLPALLIREDNDDVGGPEAVAPSLTLEVGEADATTYNDMNGESLPHAVVRNEKVTAYV